MFFKPKADMLVTRIENIEETIVVLSNSIGHLKMLLAQQNARISTATRKPRNEDIKYKEMLEDLLGGEIIGVQSDKSNSSSNENSSTDSASSV